MYEITRRNKINTFCTSFKSMTEAKSTLIPFCRGICQSGKNILKFIILKILRPKSHTATQTKVIFGAVNGTSPY